MTTTTVMMMITIKMIVVMMITTITITMGLLYNETNVTSYSRTEFNEFFSSLVIDGDPKTCFKSGFGFKEWFLLDLGITKFIRGVKVKGIIHSSNIRVGDDFDDIGEGHGFDTNSFCFFTDNSKEYFSKMVDEELTCAIPLEGRYVSIQMVDPILVDQLIICQLEIVE